MSELAPTAYEMKYRVSFAAESEYERKQNLQYTFFFYKTSNTQQCETLVLIEINDFLVNIDEGLFHSIDLEVVNYLTAAGSNCLYHSSMTMQSGSELDSPLFTFSDTEFIQGGATVSVKAKLDIDLSNWATVDCLIGNHNLFWSIYDDDGLGSLITPNNYYG